MKVSEYEKLISQNVAPDNATGIGVYRKKTGVRMGGFLLQNLRPPKLGEKLYSFGALSDVHLQYDTAPGDFQKALTYLNDTENVRFTCVCGDLTDNGQATDFQQYQSYVNTYSPNTPVYECAGNHDVETTALTKNGLKEYTGHTLYYSFECEDDVFIMFGMTGWLTITGETFSTESLQWLYETLEMNRNKRCFVFQHVPRFDGSGKPYSPLPTGNLLNCTSGNVFVSLMEHYKNVIWFHGHTHMKFNCQEDCDYANYDRMFGCHSIHVPSLAATRDYENNEYISIYSDSEGYVVDVYKNHIVLRGRDFVNEKFLPIARYCIKTDLTNIIANTFVDSTGTITT